MENIKPRIKLTFKVFFILFNYIYYFEFVIYYIKLIRVGKDFGICKVQVRKKMIVK